MNNTKGGSHGNKRSITIKTRTLVIQRNIFTDQFYELLHFFSGDFGNLKRGLFFSPAGKIWQEMAQAVTKIRETPIHLPAQYSRDGNIVQSNYRIWISCHIRVCVH